MFDGAKGREKFKDERTPWAVDVLPSHSMAAATLASSVVGSDEAKSCSFPPARRELERFSRCYAEHQEAGSGSFGWD